ncbi:MAG: META domain-containing protein [Acidimicrobiales bacterium]
MPGPRWLPILALSGALALAACGSSGDASPTVAPLDLDGVYEIGSWTGPDAPRGSASDGYAQIDLDARFGAFTVATDCGVQLGSYSLLADGRAGITVAGSRRISCDAGAEDRQQRLLDTLARVDGWSGGDDRLTLTSGAGDELVLVRPAG